MKEMSFNKILKTILIFIIYLSYSKILEILLSLIGMSGILINLIGDILFLAGILYFYKDNLKDDYQKWKEISFKKKALSILGYVGCIFLLNIIMGMVTQIFIPEAADSTTGNASAISNLFNTSFIYTLFKTLLFASIAEEIVFKESIHDIVNNKILFVMISSFIYAMLNIIYGDLNNPFLWLDFMQFFLLSLVLSIAYTRSNNNIFMVIFVKFIYNLIPTILLILTSLVK